MLAVLLCALSMIFGTLKNTLSKNLIAMQHTPEQVHRINTVSMLTGFVCLAIYAAATHNYRFVTVYTVIFAVIYSVLSLISQILLILAMNCGSVAFSSLIFSCGFIPSTLLGLWYYNESASVGQIIGIVALLVSMYIFLSPKKDGGKTPIKWYLYAFGSFICAGIVGFLQKYHQSSPDKDALSSMLVIVFLMNTVFSLILFLTTRTKNTKRLNLWQTEFEIIKSFNISDKRKRKFFLPLCFALGVVFAVQNLNNTYITGLLPSAVVFPLLNGGIILCTSVAACIFFREHLRKMQWFGLILGICSMVLVGVS